MKSNANPTPELYTFTSTALMMLHKDPNRSSISFAPADPPSSPESDRPSPRRSHTAPSRVLTGQKPKRPDWFLVCCYMLVYLEVAWLVMILWRSYGKPIGDIVR